MDHDILVGCGSDGRRNSIGPFLYRAWLSLSASSSQAHEKEGGGKTKEAR